MRGSNRIALAGLAAGLGLLTVGGVVHAQLEGAERGVPPLDSSSSFEVSGIEVDVAGPNAEAARLGGWREAQRRAWRSLWGRTHGGGAPGLSDSTLDGMVSGIIVENEQIGPRRYIATLGVLFDRARTGQMLGVTGRTRRSAPMLVIPVSISGGVATALELRNPWQEAWARFRTGNSAVDYVRPVGTGADPLLLNAGQTGRRGRILWRQLLDSYGAADVVVPAVELFRQFPGGPVIGRFTAFHGPDRRPIGSFTLRVESADGLGGLLDQGVRRLDEVYVAALASGRLVPDPSLVIEEPAPEEIEEALLEEGVDVYSGEGVAGISTLQIQYETPTPGAVAATEGVIRSILGVRSAVTSSLALGGVSVMRVAYEGEGSALVTALRARGYDVAEDGSTLRISRSATPTPTPSPSPDPPTP